jgi:hypothetical protein
MLAITCVSVITLTCVCVGVDVDGAILDPRGDHHIFCHIAGDLTSQYGRVATDDVLIINVHLILLPDHCNQVRTRALLFDLPTPPPPQY